VSRIRGAWSAVAALVAAAAVARLPQLLSPNLLAEGDECLVGLMGLHVTRGHDLPLFFYGQKYGLAIVEASAAAASFAIFGPGPVALKAPMLAIWIAGVVFYFRAFARVFGAARGVWIALLLVLMPAWGVTSMKAWSGYVTAFAATGLVLDLLTGNAPRHISTWLAAGVVTALVLVAQPLWVPGLVPIVLFHLVTTRRARCWAAYACGAAAPLAALAIVTRYWLAGVNEVWFRPEIGNPHLLASVPALVEQIYVTLSGSFYFWQTVAPGRITAAMAAFWSGLLCLLLIRQGYRLVTRRHLTWSYVLAASILSTIVTNWLLLDPRDARYMLPIAVPLVFLAGVELFDLVDRVHLPARGWVAAVVLVCAVQAVAMREFAGYTFMWWTNAPGSPSETKSLHTVIGYLESRGVTRVYSMNALLEWQITFYSGESVIARWKGDRDRYPPYVTAVDRALQAGRPVAIVGYTGFTYGLETLVPDPNAIVDIDGKYFVYLAPDRDLLARAGFRLTR
jgi:4-amino-4-deoxy-L-arabinose transferase-like glycosyltransferase